MRGGVKKWWPLSQVRVLMKSCNCAIAAVTLCILLTVGYGNNSHSVCVCWAIVIIAFITH